MKFGKSSRRILRAASLTATAVVLLSSFQNCSPMSGVTPDTNSSTSTKPPVPTGTPPPNYAPPSWATSAAATNTTVYSTWFGGSNAPDMSLQTSSNMVTANSKITVFSGNDTAVNPGLGGGATALSMLGIKFSSDTNVAISGTNGLPGSATMKLNAGVECVSGSSTVSATITDPNNKSLNLPKNFTVSYTNTCPAESIITASDSAFGAQFGTQVAFDGVHALVTAPNANGSTGNAYVYGLSGSTWVQQQELQPAASGTGLYSAAIKGNYLALGAFGSPTGAVYVYELIGSSWTLQQTLTPSAGVGTANGFTNFGRSLAIIGTDTIVVGAPGVDSPTTGAVGSGVVYVYENSGASWALVQSLEAAHVIANANYGESIAVSGNNLVVGAPLSPTTESAMVAASTAPIKLGSAYIYTFNGATFASEVMLQPTISPWTNVQFGSSVAINGSEVAIAAPLYDGSQTYGTATQSGTAANGAVYRYKLDGTAQGMVQDTVAKQMNAGDRFGVSMAYLGSALWIAKPGDGSTALTGQLVKYNVNGLTATAAYRLVARNPNRTTKATYGLSINAASGMLLIGAPGTTVKSNGNAGMAFVVQAP